MMNTSPLMQKELKHKILVPTSLAMAALVAVAFSAIATQRAEAQQPTPAVAAAGDAQLPANAGDNLALNKKYVCSAPNTQGWANGLVDGSWEEGAAHTFATDQSDQFPKTVTIDLEKPADISLAMVGVPTFGATKTIAVAVSTDGTNFKDVGSYVFSQKNRRSTSLAFLPCRPVMCV